MSCDDGDVVRSHLPLTAVFKFSKNFFDLHPWGLPHYASYVSAKQVI
jgi:hypothetical protein